MKKRIIYIISVIALVAILSISLFACTKDNDGDNVRVYGEVKSTLEKRGFTTTLTEKALGDDQLNYLSTENLKWVLKGTYCLDDFDKTQIVFVIQYKNNDEANNASDLLKQHDYYTVENRQIKMSECQTVNNYVYYGTERAVRTAKAVTLDFMGVREDNLFFRGYEFESDRDYLINPIKFNDPQLQFISEENLHFYIKGHKTVKDVTDLVFCFNFDNELLLNKAIENIGETVPYIFNGVDYNLNIQVVDAYLYIGTTQGIEDITKNF